MIRSTTAVTALWILAILGPALAFSTVSPTKHNNIARRMLIIMSDNSRRMTADVVTSSTRSSDAASGSTTTQKIPLFDFSDPTLNATNKFERIDDVIMGGISSSLLRQGEGEEFARWSGVCRTDGGGFCGVRTLPFKETLDVFYADGLYITCRLSSDEEADRRIWKLTTRTEQSRGEQLYQAMFTIPNNKQNDDKWHTIHIPFDDFKLVRGARLIQNATALNTSDGLYQIGMSMSKFIMSNNMTALDNFRPGFFELQIQQLGLYCEPSSSSNSSISSTQQIIIRNNLQDDGDEDTTKPTATTAAATRNNLTAPTAATLVNSMTKEEALAQRPLLLKMLLPLSRLFFTEQSQRRKSAMRLLTKERGLSRMQAILFGLQWRGKQVGMVKSLGTSLAIITTDTLRQVTKSVLQLGLLLPLKYTAKAIGKVTTLFSKKGNSSPSANSAEASP